MNISIRLLILLIFCAFVLPKIFLNQYDSTIGQQKRIENTDNQLESDLNDKDNDRQSRLSNFIDSLNIDDEKLNNCIKQQVKNQFLYAKKPIDTLTVERLDCSRWGVQSIRGISSLSKLKVLLLEYNDISDVSELANLDKLERIDLSANSQLSSVRALENIYTLKHVELPSKGEISCRDAQSLTESIVFRHGESYRKPISFCAGRETRTITKIQKKKQRGETLSNDEKRQLQLYQRNKEIRY